MDKAIILDTPEAIHFFRVASLKQALKLKLLGINVLKSGQSIVKVANSMGFKGRTARVLLPQVEAEVERLIAERHNHENI